MHRTLPHQPSPKGWTQHTQVRLRCVTALGGPEEPEVKRASVQLVEKRLQTRREAQAECALGRWAGITVVIITTCIYKYT